MDVASLLNDPKTNEKLKAYRWVISFDPKTGQRGEVVICPAANAEFHKRNFELWGLNARIYECDEVTRLRAEGKLE